MKKIILVTMVLSSFLFAGMNNKGLDYNKFDKISSQELVRKFSNDLAKNLPMRIDYLTTLVNIMGIGNTVLAKKEVDIEHKDIKTIWKTKKDALINAMYKIDAQNICYSKTWQYLVLKRNIITKFDYVDKNSKPLFDYTVEKADCEKMLSMKK